MTVGNQVDEEELEDELEQMQQEQLDEQMTKTGTVPVSDAVHQLPAAANGPRKYLRYLPQLLTKPQGYARREFANRLNSQGQGCGRGGRRRRGGAPEVASRNGYVELSSG